MNKNNTFLILTMLFMSFWHSVPLQALFLKKHSTRNNIFMGLIVVGSGLLLMYWYFKKPKEIVQPKIEEMPEEKIKIVINIPSNPDNKDKHSENQEENKKIIITQENLETDDPLIQQLQDAAIQIGTVTENLKYYELEQEQQDLALKALNENSVKLAMVLSKNKVEEGVDKQWAQGFINSVGMMLKTILPKIQEKMTETKTHKGKILIQNIKTLGGKNCPVSVNYFQIPSKKDNKDYFFIDDILRVCYLKLKNDKSFYYDNFKQIVPRENLEKENLMLLIYGKGYTANTDALLDVNEYQKMNCMHLIVRKNFIKIHK